MKPIANRTRESWSTVRGGGMRGKGQKKIKSGVALRTATRERNQRPGLALQSFRCHGDQQLVWAHERGFP